MVDLSESERELRIADDAERSDWLFVGLAALAALATILIAGDRLSGLALAAGAAAFGSAVLLVSFGFDRPDDPVGYGIAFDRIVDQVTSTSKVVALVAGTVLVATVAVSVLRSRRPAARRVPSLG